MTIVQITPGAGGMHCGNCFRDNAFVTALNHLGHSAMLLPMYLPMTLDESSHQQGTTPIFFGGINVYFDQKIPGYRFAPDWLRRLFASPRLLSKVAGRAASTRPEKTGDLVLSMLEGELGYQARELDEIVDWLLAHAKPDVICLSNGMLMGLARRLRAATGALVVGTFQGEDSYLDGLSDAYRSACWKRLAERSNDAQLLIAPSRYYAEHMAGRLGLDSARIRISPNGINLQGYRPSPSALDEACRTPVLGFFARMCPQKGLDRLVEAFMLLHQRGKVPALRLKIGGSCGPNDRPFVNRLKHQLVAAGLMGRVEFHPNLDRAAKIEFLRSLTVFSVPALYGEAFGLYLIEAMAAGVPAVQPRHGAFPELIEATGGGKICEPGSSQALAEAIEFLLLDPSGRRKLAEQAFKSAHEQFDVVRTAAKTVELFQPVKVLDEMTPNLVRKIGGF